MKLFEIFGEIKLDDKKSSKILSDTEGKAKSVSDKLGGMAKTAGKWGAGIATAVGAGATALGVMATNASSALDAIHKGSQKMGVSTDAYQEMEYWASQNGMAQEDMEKAVGRLNTRLGEAAAGNEKYSGALEKLGVNMDEVRAGTLSTEDAFAQSIQALSGMSNEQEKAALASELFGTKLSRELLPALNDGSLSFEDAKAKAEELGIVLSEDSVNAGAKFSDTMDDIKRALGGAATQIGADLMPMFQKMMDWVIEHMPEIREVMKTVFEKIGEFVNIAITVFRDHLLPIFVTIYEWVKENWPTIAAIIKAAFDTVKFIWENVLSPVLALLWETLKGVVSWVSENWPTIAAIFKTVFDAIKLVWDNILSPVLGFLWEGLKKVVDFVANYFGGMQTIVENVFEGIGKAVDAVADTFKWLADKIEDAYDWLTKWNGKEVAKKTPSTSNFGGIRPSKYIDGTNADGLARVPFDGYISELHENEEVLRADDPRNQNNGGRTLPRKNNITVNINGANVMDDYGVDRLMDRVMDRMAVLGVR